MTDNTTKPTPGPWHWDADEYGYGTDGVKRWRYRVTALGRTIMQTYYTEAERGQAEADTKLAASAPELLEHAMYLTQRLADKDDPYRAADIEIHAAALRAAIKRATGATP